MNFFALNGDIAHLAGKKVCDYFKMAIHVPGKPDSQIVVHREFVRDVITLFADKTELSFAQACQIAREYSFIHARKMHQKATEKVPAYIKNAQGEKVDNPQYIRFRELGEMQPSDHQEFMRQGWIWATTLIHPHSKPSHRGASEMSRETETRIAKQIFKHLDETREAHQKRTIEALNRALTDPRVLQMASDRLMDRVEKTLRAAE